MASLEYFKIEEAKRNGEEEELSGESVGGNFDQEESVVGEQSVAEEESVVRDKSRLEEFWANGENTIGIAFNPELNNDILNEVLGRERERSTELMETLLKLYISVFILYILFVSIK